jgi:hypothetical protein
VTRLIFAYLDPGSSSMIVQLFLGGLAAAGVALKMYWRRVLVFLRIRKELDDEETTPGTTVGQTAANGNGTAAPEREPVETTKR